MKKNLYALVGNPVIHSLSPVLHNYWFKKYNIEANYSLMMLKERDLESAVQKVRNKELNGINVTLPYKQKIIPFIYTTFYNQIGIKQNNLKTIKELRLLN